MLVPLQFDEALLTRVIGVLADVADHIGLSDIPIGHDPKRDNDAYRETSDFRNVLHAGIVCDPWLLNN
jgi:hypothetical protein